MKKMSAKGAKKGTIKTFGKKAKSTIAKNKTKGKMKGC